MNNSALKGVCCEYYLMNSTSLKGTSGCYECLLYLQIFNSYCWSGILSLFRLLGSRRGGMGKPCLLNLDFAESSSIKMVINILMW